jgi:hypothetical protein
MMQYLPFADANALAAYRAFRERTTHADIVRFQAGDGVAADNVDDDMASAGQKP